MPLSRLSTLLGGLLLSRRGRSLAARHAGKIALATLAWRLWKSRRAPIQGAQRAQRLAKIRRRHGDDRKPLRARHGAQRAQAFIRKPKGHNRGLHGPTSHACFWRV